jgi:hypothetical protein
MARVIGHVNDDALGRHNAVFPWLADASNPAPERHRRNLASRLQKINIEAGRRLGSPPYPIAPEGPKMYTFCIPSGPFCIPSLPIHGGQPVEIK